MQPHSLVFHLVSYLCVTLLFDAQTLVYALTLESKAAISNFKIALSDVSLFGIQFLGGFQQ